MKTEQFPDLEDDGDGSHGADGGSSPERRPSKAEVRDWLARVIASRRPPPAMDDIKRDLWHTKGKGEGRGGS